MIHLPILIARRDDTLSHDAAASRLNQRILRPSWQGAAYCAGAQRGSEKVQVGTPSFRIFSAFAGSFSLCH
jgi:hypothetical protein